MNQIICEKFKTTSKWLNFLKNGDIKSFLCKSSSESYLWRTFEDRESCLERILKWEPSRRLLETDILARVTTVVFNVEWAYSGLRSDDGTDVVLTIKATAKISDPRAFLNEYGLQRLKTRDSISTTLLENELIQSFKQPIAQEIATQTYDALKKQDALPVSSWHKKLSEWCNLTWLELKEVKSVCYESAAADKEEQFRKRQEYQELDNKWELKFKQQQASFEVAKQQIENDKKLTEMQQQIRLEELERKREQQGHQYRLDMKKLEKERAGIEAEIEQLRNNKSSAQEPSGGWGKKGAASLVLAAFAVGGVWGWHAFRDYQKQEAQHRAAAPRQTHQNAQAQQHINASLTAHPQDNIRDAYYQGDKPTLVIMPFKVQQAGTIGGGLNVNEVARQVTQRSNGLILQSRHFHILDFKYDDQFERERQLLFAGTAPTQQLAQLGEQLGADYLLAGTIIEVRGSTTYREWYGVEVATHEILLTIEVRVVEFVTRRVHLADSLTVNFSHVDRKPLRQGGQYSSPDSGVLNRFIPNLVEKASDRLHQEFLKVVPSMLGMEMMESKIYLNHNPYDTLLSNEDEISIKSFSC